MIQYKSYADICTNELTDGAIKHYHEPFIQDYLVLHCLLKAYKVKSVFEIGCNEGVGTKIICNAVGKEGTVYSLDLPRELAHLSKQHPFSEGKGENKVGHKCNLPFTLLFGNSLTFDYSKYPCEAFYVDGEHLEVNVFHEVSEILKLTPKIVILHDTDMPEVMTGLKRAVDRRSNNYTIYRVVDTRISYLLKS